SDQLHVGEDVGVAGEIDHAIVIETQNVTGGFASIDDLAIVQNSAAMDCVSHGDVDGADLLRSAFIHGMQVLDALALEPMAGFVNCANLVGMLLGQRNRIVNVIEMTMGDQHEIDFLDGEAGGVLWITLCPGVHENMFAGWKHELERTMSKPSNFHIS